MHKLQLIYVVSSIISSRRSSYLKYRSNTSTACNMVIHTFVLRALYPRNSVYIYFQNGLKREIIERQKLKYRWLSYDPREGSELMVDSDRRRDRSDRKLETIYSRDDIKGWQTGVI